MEVWKVAGTTVSILVLVDFSLKPDSPVVGRYIFRVGFNPCFGGFFSKTQRKRNSIGRCTKVSILVLVDFSLKLLGIPRKPVNYRQFQSLFWWIFL